jgi:two-component system, sensor histidine kinase LadS
MRFLHFLILLCVPVLAICQPPEIKIPADSLPAAVPHKFLLKVDTLADGQFILDRNWLYSFADDSAFSDTDYDDRKWDTVNIELFEDDQKRIGFKGFSWFRLHFTPDTSLSETPLSLIIDQEGASEIYFNGKLIREFGKVSTEEATEEQNTGNLDVMFISPEYGKENVLAIRYSNTIYEHSYDAQGHLRAGMTVTLAASSQAFVETVQKLYAASTVGLGIGIFFFTLGLVHFLLWLFYRARRSNLYFALFSCLTGYYFFYSYLRTTLENPHSLDLFTLFLVLSIPMFTVSFLSVLYSAFYEKFPKQFWVFFGTSVVASGLIVSRVPGEVFYVALIIVATLVESLRVVAVALRKKKKGSAIIGSGFGFFGLFVLVMVVEIFITGGFTLDGLSFWAILLFVTAALSIFGLPLSMSIFLAYDYGSTNKALINKLTEVEDLSARTLEQEKEKQKILETQKETLEHQVAERTFEINEKKKEIEEKNKDITDSINYAQRIQRSILPTEEEIKNIFPQSFVLFMPRDIVSGDFYWFDEIDGKKFAVCADCTGHGVPGALMSMIGCNLLQQIIVEKKIYSPAEILSNLQHEVRKTLKQQSGDSKDGMDLSVCMMEGEKIFYAGAQRPLLVVKNGVVEEIKADKQSIGGGYWGDELTFTQHELNRKDVQALFMFSDGFPDQFGGPKGKKFKYKQLVEVLQSNASSAPEDQKNKLQSEFLKWKGNLEQIDDVCVIGIKI